MSKEQKAVTPEEIAAEIKRLGGSFMMEIRSQDGVYGFRLTMKGWFNLRFVNSPGNRRVAMAALEAVAGEILFPGDEG